MDEVEPSDVHLDYSLRTQFARTLVATTVAFIAGRVAEKAFDKVVVVVRNRGQ